MTTAKAVSGANLSGSALWSEHAHKRALLTGLKIDNQSLEDETLKFMDCFLTDASQLNATGATQAAENVGKTAGAVSGKVRLQITVPTGEFVSLGEEDLKGIEFFGDAKVIGSVNTSDCVIVAAYAHR